MELLRTTNLSKSFGGIKAVQNFEVHMNTGEIIGLIGPNGAGKTTAFNLLTGVYQPTTGDIFFNGKNIIGHKPYNITKLGVARTFQNIRLFSEISVLDNVKIAYTYQVRYGFIEAIGRIGRYGPEEAEIERQAIELLKIFQLEENKYDLAKNLPYGKQRRLEIARALAAKPKLLLLDEPAAGMNPQETAELTTLIKEIRDQFDLTVLLIEHDMGLVMKVCDRIYVLDYGKILATGLPAEIQNNPAVIKAYLGEEV